MTGPDVIHGPRSAGIPTLEARHLTKHFALDTGSTAYRYYLVWITKLAPDADNAEISEIRLFQEVAA